MSATLAMWTVYERPRDYPGGFVARLHIARPNMPDPIATEQRVTGPTLEAVRAQLPFGLYRMPRHPSDDPVIVETWL